MVRTQVQLTEKQSKQLKRLAAKKGVSVAEVIRKSVDETLRRENMPDEEELRRRAMALVGAFRSDKDDVSIRHDDYLAEAYSH